MEARKRKEANKDEGNGTCKGNGKCHHNDNEVLIPEVLGPETVPVVVETLGTVGFLPTERVRVREALGKVQDRIIAANDDIIKVAETEAQFTEAVAEKAKQQLSETIKFHRTLGA